MGVWLSEGDEQGKESENENDDFAAGLAMHVLSDGGAYTPLVQYDTYTQLRIICLYIFLHIMRRRKRCYSITISPPTPLQPLQIK